MSAMPDLDVPEAYVPDIHARQRAAIASANAVIGRVMCHPELLADVPDIEIYHFHDPVQRDLWSAIRSLEGARAAINVDSVIAKVADHDAMCSAAPGDGMQRRCLDRLMELRATVKLDDARRQLAQHAARLREFKIAIAAAIAAKDVITGGNEEHDVPPPDDAPDDASDAPEDHKPNDDAKPSKGKRKRKNGIVGAATDYIGRFCMHPDGPTLRRWRGDWYKWIADRGHYLEISDERVDASLFRDFKIDRPQDVRDVRSALIAVDGVLVDEVAIGSWIDGPALGHQPHEVAACPNGLIHLPTRQLTPATPRYFATTALGVPFDERAPASGAWLAFLRQLWPNDDDSIALLQEWFGYLLTPDTRQQKMMLLVGPKRSGKGTIARVLKALLGGDSVAGPTLASLATNFGLWPLIGKTAAIIGDARLGGRTDIASVVERLLSVSGEDAQTIDRKHREPWTGYLSSRITIISNELPRFSDASDALANRMLILELEQSFIGREDTNLTETLIAELPGILLWALEGWDRLRRRGRFQPPASSAQLVDDLADLASPVAAWIRERCELGAEHQVDCTTAYRDYEEWCASEGHQHKATLTMFGRDLKAAAQVSRVQVRDGLIRTRVYRGMRLRS